MSIEQEALIGFALFAASELIGMSRLRDNSVLQMLLHMAQELFPYELQRRERPSRSNRMWPRGEKGRSIRRGP